MLLCNLVLIIALVGKQLKQKLQKYHSRAATIIITGESFHKRTADVLKILNWEFLEKRREYLKSILVFKILTI